MSWADIQSFLESWFLNPGIEWHFILIAIGVALVFGGIWLAFYRQPRSTNLWLPGVMLFGAFFTVVAVALVQLPLQYYIGQGMSDTWSYGTLNAWLLLASIPTLLVGGLVQEGAKMVPMVAWWRGRKNLDPKLGLAIGAMAGFGFGVFNGFWINAYTLGAGWSFDLFSEDWFSAISPFWQSFFFIGLQTATSALAGYGLAKGLGWQFFLIAGVLNSALTYSSVLYQKGYLTSTQADIYIAGVAALVTIAALILRYRKGKAIEPVLPPPEPAQPNA